MLQKSNDSVQTDTRSADSPIVKTNIFSRLWFDDSGQDVVEYALLSAFIGLGSYGGFIAIQNAMSTSYGNWDTGQQNLWQPPDPGFGS